jgi:low affinity Fe/Cu permease
MGIANCLSGRAGVTPGTRGAAHMKILEQFSQKATLWTGSSWGFLIANVIIAVWVVAGPFVNYSDTWQLVINTLTTLVTFDMVFLIQRSQNKDSLAIHTKLNELLAASRASNRLIDLENFSEEEIRAIHDRYVALAAKAANTTNPCARLSVEMVQGAAEEATAKAE